MNQQSIGERLAGLGIKDMPGLQPGIDYRATCPQCEGGRSRDKCLSVKITDCDGAVMQCHRGTCGWTQRVPDAVRGAEADRRRHESAKKRAAEPQVKAARDWSAMDRENRPAEMLAWFAKRGISEETVIELGVFFVARHRFPQDFHLGKRADGEIDWQKVPWTPAVVFPYVAGGRPLNHKYRDKDKRFCQDARTPRTLFNLDNLADDEAIFCEGEMDVASWFEVGERSCVSLPDGSPSKELAEDDPRRQDAKRYAPLDHAADRLKTQRRIYIAGDDDEPGRIHREELARRLGKQRCWIITYPEGCKDPNEVLRKHGPEALKRCKAQAEPYPLEGLRTLERGALLRYRHGPARRLYSTGWQGVDQLFEVPSDGRLFVVTGIPTMGKALALDTPLPTPSGWTTMGDVRVGDCLYAEDGTVCRVIGATEVMLGRPCYRMTFADGTTVVADAGHQWLTRSEASRHPGVVTTAEIAASMKVYGKVVHQIDPAEPLAGRGGPRPAKRFNQHRIVACDPVESVAVRCIEVDSQSHLFLATRSFIPTHNSAIVDALMCQFASLYGWHCTIFSPENNPIEQHAAALAERLVGKSFFDHASVRAMDDFDLIEAEDLVRRHFTFLTHDDHEKVLSLDYLLDRADDAVLRHGSRNLVIDPWNELEHGARARGQGLVEYETEALMRIKRWCQLRGCNGWLVAHPQKLQREKNGGYIVPGGYEISGGAHWYNKADVGLTVHRGDAASLVSEIHVWKVKFKWMGHKGVTSLRFDPVTSRLEDAFDPEEYR